MTTFARRAADGGCWVVAIALLGVYCGLRSSGERERRAAIALFFSPTQSLPRSRSPSPRILTRWTHLHARRPYERQRTEPCGSYGVVWRTTQETFYETYHDCPMRSRCVERWHRDTGVCSRCRAVRSHCELRRAEPDLDL